MRESYDIQDSHSTAKEIIIFINQYIVWNERDKHCQNALPKKRYMEI